MTDYDCDDHKIVFNGVDSTTFLKVVEIRDKCFQVKICQKETQNMSKGGANLSKGGPERVSKVVEKSINHPKESQKWSKRV